MRRLFLSAVGLMPLALFLGCQHTAGKCDCDKMLTLECPCWLAHGGNGVITPAAPVPGKPLEPIKEAPKDAPKDTPKEPAKDPAKDDAKPAPDKE